MSLCDKVRKYLSAKRRVCAPPLGCWLGPQVCFYSCHQGDWPPTVRWLLEYRFAATYYPTLPTQQKPA